jgi:hypothetical protein
LQFRSCERGKPESDACDGDQASEPWSRDLLDLTKAIEKQAAQSIALGAGMSQPMGIVLYGLETGDPLVYASVVVTLVSVGLVACVLPALTATRTDPVVVMRPG